MLVIQTIIILCILIFVHELGHFAAAKLTGVKVNEFAIGMGPAFFKRTRGETKYSLRVFPIGGFCSLESTENYDDDDEVDEVLGDGAVEATFENVATAYVTSSAESYNPRAFENKPARVKAFILLAGSAMNIVLAILILSVMAFVGTAPSNTINTITPDLPAYHAGLIPGDKIVSIDGETINNWNDILTNLANSHGDRIQIGIIRDGNELMISSKVTTLPDGRRGIGIGPAMERAFNNPLTSLVNGTRTSFSMLADMLRILQQLFTGHIPPSDLVGVVGIAYLVDETARMGMRPLFWLIALISMNLAIINLLPFPALDGGRILFVAINKLTGRAISPKVESTIHIIGIALLILLMLYVTWNDIWRFVIGTFTFWY